MASGTYPHRATSIIPEKGAMNGFEVDHDFPGVGRRIMLLKTRKVLYETSPDATILLAFTDITAQRAIEMEKEDLLEKTEELLNKNPVLLQEMQHRVASLIIPKLNGAASSGVAKQLRKSRLSRLIFCGTGSPQGTREGGGVAEVDSFAALRAPAPIVDLPNVNGAG
jgi:hypothetical protein